MCGHYCVWRKGYFNFMDISVLLMEILFKTLMIILFFVFTYQDMTDNGNHQLVVRAKFNFQQTNEDELSFSKGDIIHVTRVEEGGWWEGTLNGKTGWFPSNYVREIKSNGKF